VLASVKPETIVIVDAAQAVARMAVLPARVDAIVASAHKIGGFAGAGALVLRGRARGLRGPWTGGGQEGGLRPGTEALVLHAAFGAAARVVETTRAAHRALAPLRDRLEQALVTACGVEIVARGPRLDNTSALAIPDVDGDALRLALDQAGVLVGFGSACSALAPEPSSSLLALGLSPDLARATVRFSLGPTTTSDEIDAAIPRIVTVIERLRLRRRDRTRATYLKV
jgi:cysteine desulfurase